MNRRGSVRISRFKQQQSVRRAERQRTKKKRQYRHLIYRLHFYIIHRVYIDHEACGDVYLEMPRLPDSDNKNDQSYRHIMI